MRRSTYVTLIVASATVAALATGVAVVAQSPDATKPTEAAPLLPKSVLQGPDFPEALRAFDPQSFIGVGSCAASGCHGGAKPQPGTPHDNAAWRSSYVVWATSDPHARAYQTLSKPEAAAIVRKLDRVAADKPVSPERDRRCTTCHATANPTEPALASFAADGIGCESCHGAAKGWLGEHFLVRSDAPGATPADVHQEKLRLEELGMLDTDNLAVQAQTCVRCHVGDRAGPDGVRDMNHDMIAAGHPALNFEFAAYKRRMPRHWSVPKTDPERADRERRAWVVGQFASATAAMRLSADRAKASLANSTDAAKPNAPHAPWPEFSEYACYRCHHALRSDATSEASAQQKLALDRRRRLEDAKLPSTSVGTELWGTWNAWHFSQLPHLMVKGKPDPSQTLRRGVNPFLSDDELRNGADDLSISAEGYRGGAALLSAIEPGELTADRLFVDLAGAAAAGPLTWDEATQAYLGCVAMYRSRRAATGKSLNTADDEAGAILKQLHEALRFDKPGDRRFNSPANYDRAEVKKLFEKLAAAAREEK